MKMAGINLQSRSGNPKGAMNGLIGSNRFGTLDLLFTQICWSILAEEITRCFCPLIFLCHEWKFKTYDKALQDFLATLIHILV
jgi:hypothetical protein